MKKFSFPLILLTVLLTGGISLLSRGDETEMPTLQECVDVYRSVDIKSVPDSSLQDVLDLGEHIAVTLQEQDSLAASIPYFRDCVDMALRMDSVDKALVLATNVLSALHSASTPQAVISYADSLLARIPADAQPSLPALLDMYAWKASCEYSIGLFDKSIDSNQKALDITGKLYDKDSREYLFAQSNYAVSYSTRDPIAALRMFEQAVAKLGKICDGNDPEYLNAVMNLAQSNIDLGNYDAAARNMRDVAAKLDSIDTREAMAYSVYAHSKLGNICWVQGDLESCEREMETALAKQLKLSRGEKDIKYYSGLHNLAVFIRSSNPQKALEYETEAVEARKRLLGETNRDYIGSLNNLVWIYSFLGRNEEAYDMSRKVLDVSARKFGHNSQEYIQVLDNMICMASKVDDNSRAGVPDSVLADYTEVMRNLVKRNFQQLSSDERPAFWDMFSENFGNLYKAAHKYATPALVGSAYDAVLFQKGVLLSTDVEFQRLISSSSDPEVKKALGIIARNNETLSDPSLADDPRRDQISDSLIRQNKSIELSLQSKILEIGDFTSVFDVDAEAVRKNLKKGEIAVEIVCLPGEATRYCALVLDTDSPAPRLVDLFNESALNGKRGWKEMAPVIMESLLPVFGNVSAVYFSPAGIFNSLPLESFPAGEGITVAEKWKFCRLSSTRELALGHRPASGKSAGVFGGMDFDMADSPAAAPEASHTRDFDLARDLNMRNGAQPLPQTKAEAEEICGIMKMKGILPVSFTGRKGTEESFKARSGKKDRILHIATHGFYSDGGAGIALKNSSGRELTAEEIALSRSGLLFSGVNRILRGQEIPEDREDGILTSAEISRLNFHGIDLVVLSACETGLGDISAEGVFGLQRGFKKAGVGSLVMSLWKVDDDATRMLMVEFYRNYLSGKSKRESLLEAQKTLRNYVVEIEKDPDASLTPSQRRQKERRGEKAAEVVREKVKPYADPRYWAAFILLDALD